MTERPIPFSAEMVRAILAGRKTQTRRVMKVQPYPDSIVTVEHFNQTVIDRHGDMQPGPEIFGAHWDDGEYGCRCPYGAPGDLLWVRETWAQYPIELNPELCDAWYKATSNGPPQPFKWRPSIHMPRWASRIRLRIRDVRVERLQDITEDDARAEGVGYKNPGYLPGTKGNWIGSFAYLWNHIHGAGAWDDNPWVWVLSFERVKP